ncbi:hypothetical protein RI129_002460 [Pyrocoelia pectoralis]|uniref:THAP-type domain-containing protein n=1 Tax=Pyrocoelia pectoralis TaxID=417401 RepID=A0AAN7VMT5_9COLE
MYYLKEFCRFCLSFNGNFHNMSSGDILEKTNCCIGEFEFYCNFPNLICTKCLEALDMFFNFRNRCLQSELILQRYVQILTQNKFPNDFVNKKLAVFVSTNFGTQCSSNNVQKVSLTQRVPNENDTSQIMSNTVLPVHGFNDFEDDFLEIDTELLYNDIQIKEEQISEIDDILVDDKNVLEVSSIVEAPTDQVTLSEPIPSFNDQNTNDKDVSNFVNDSSILKNALQNNTPLPLKVVKVSDDQRYSITHFLSKRKLDCTDQSEKRIKTVGYNLSEKNRPTNTPPDELNELFLKKRETFQDSFIETTKVTRLPTPSLIPIFKTPRTSLPTKPKHARVSTRVSKKSLCAPKSQVNPQLQGERSAVTDFESGIALHCILNIRNDTNETLITNDKPKPDTNETLKKNDNPKPLNLKNLNQKVGLKFISLTQPSDNLVPVNSNMVSKTWPPDPTFKIVINKEHNYSATSRSGEIKKTMEHSNKKIKQYRGKKISNFQDCVTKSTTVTPPRMIILSASDWKLLADKGRAESVYLQEQQPSNGASFIGPIPPVTQNQPASTKAATSHDELGQAQVNRSFRNQCAYTGCKNVYRYGRKQVSFFRFPRTEERSLAWIKASGQDDLYNYTTINLYNNFRICSNHFSSNCFTTTAKNKLQPSAVPIPYLIQPNKNVLPTNQMHNMVVPPLYPFSRNGCGL